METRLTRNSRFRFWTRGLQLLAAGALLSALAPAADRFGKPIDGPNPVEARRWKSRMAKLDRARAGRATQAERMEIAAGKTGRDRLLVLLVEFGGPDTFDFVPTGENRSKWDPIGKADSSEWTGTVGDCSAIIQKNNITGTRRFTYSGPLHNTIERPRSESDASGTMVWTPDFSRDYYQNLVFGNGVKLEYARQDGSRVSEDLTGLSMRNYYLDASLRRYDVEGEVYGWIKVPHSVWWYGADPCPGRLSGSTSAEEGSIPGAGTPHTLVVDAIEAFKSSNPAFNWSRFDTDGDGLLDHLVLITAGLGESTGGALLDRTAYGEAAVWPHSSRVVPPYEIVPGIRADAYIVMGEASGLGTVIHEFAHSIGAEDLYNIAGAGSPSPSMWTVMADTWIGTPMTSTAVMFDPLHLDAWGWLDPLVIRDPAEVHEVTIGQASRFSAATGVYRGVKIQLPDGVDPLPVAPDGTGQWWSGQRDETNSRMTLTKPVAIPAEGRWKLTYDAAWRIEEGWDFLFTQISLDGGATWRTLTNEDTACIAAPTWSGPGLGLPADMCAAGIGGFSGVSRNWPDYRRQEFDLSAFAGSEILIRLWYMTDIALNLDGAFVDNIAVTDGAEFLFGDTAEAESEDWVFEGTWQRNDGLIRYSHGYYLQWRNTASTGGADRTLGDSRWRYGPANPGLLVWYHNGRYTNNFIDDHLFDPPSFGPKGMLLVVDAHPDPYRSPQRLLAGFPNESANATDRSQMRDAPFSLLPTVPFRYTLFGATVDFTPRPGVPGFSDAKGYYPGLEHVPLGPRETGGPGWITAAWSASAVLPAVAPYPVRAPGYRAGTPILYGCSANADAGTLGCVSRGGNLSIASDGGSGDPGSVGAEYGWNAAILSQTAESARVRIWNSKGR